jgi:hypothetical protein
VHTAAEKDLRMMMGLADRVEAWARRFGIPPPPGVDVGTEREAGTAPAAPSAAEPSANGEAEEERFARGVNRER